MTPGQPLPADVSTSMASLAASATTVTVLALPSSDASLATASTAESTAAVINGSVEKSAGSPTLSAGAIVGVVIGGIALLVVAGGLFW